MPSTTMELAGGSDVESSQIFQVEKEIGMGRGILLWMLGVPLPIILLLAFFR